MKKQNSECIYKNLEASALELWFGQIKNEIPLK